MQRSTIAKRKGDGPMALYTQTYQGAYLGRPQGVLSIVEIFVRNFLANATNQMTVPLLRACRSRLQSHERNF